MNCAILVGRVGQDPEARYTGEGKAVVEFSLATSEKFKGEDQTEWHKCVVFGPSAENLANIVTKGALVRVTGKIKYETYEKDGEKKYMTKILVREWEILTSGKSSGDSEPAPKGNGKGGGKAKPQDDDQIPF